MVLNSPSTPFSYGPSSSAVFENASTLVYKGTQPVNIEKSKTYDNDSSVEISPELLQMYFDSNKLDKDDVVESNNDFND